MKAELTTIIEAATEGGYWAICPEIPVGGGYVFYHRMLMEHFANMELEE